jgi:hypothetical protein
LVLSSRIRKRKRFKTMTPLSRLVRSAFVLSAITLVMGPPKLSAGAIPIDITYQFTGTCTDCTGFGTGLLTLANYTLGTSLTAANFVSFSYSSNLISFSIPNSTDLSVFNGSLPASLSGTAPISIEDTNLPTDALIIFPDGGWCAGTHCAGDNGPSSTWNLAAVTPEPATWILLPSAVLGLGLIRRRRTQRAVKASV